jgi:hypothetical protein
MKKAALLRSLEKLKFTEYYQQFKLRFDELETLDNDLTARNAQIRKMETDGISHTIQVNFPNLDCLLDFRGQPLDVMILGLEELKIEFGEYVAKVESQFAKLKQIAGKSDRELSEVYVYSYQAFMDPTEAEMEAFQIKLQQAKDSCKNDKEVLNKKIASYQTDIGAVLSSLRGSESIRQRIDAINEHNQMVSKIGAMKSIEEFLEAFPSPTAEEMRMFTDRFKQR